MQQLLLAGIVGCWLAGLTPAVAASGSLRAGSAKPAGQPTLAEPPAEANTYNPTLLARRQPQPMVIPEELPGTDVTPPPNLGGSSNGSLLDELEPPRPIVGTSPTLENPIMDETALAEMPAEPWSSGSWFANGHRYAEVDFLVFERARPKRRREILASDMAVGGRVLRTFGETFGTEAGIRATLGQNLYRDYLNRDHSVEFTFLGINQFQIRDGLGGLGNNSLVSIPGLPGFNASDTVTADQDSLFLSYEFNYRIRSRLERDRMIMGPDGSWTRQYTQGHIFSLLFGLRYITFDERFLFTGRQDGVAAATYSGTYLVNTENDLLGVQIGGESRSQYETWSWGVRGKAGAYVNFSEASRFVTSATVPIYSAQASVQDAAFVGELSLFGAYNLSPNWTLRTSLDLIEVAGVAQAPFNIDATFSPVPRLDNHGLVTMMGLSFGMELVW